MQKMKNPQKKLLVLIVALALFTLVACSNRNELSSDTQGGEAMSSSATSSSQSISEPHSNSESAPANSLESAEQPEGTKTVMFSIQMLSEMGDYMEEKIDFSLSIPEEWTETDTEIFDADQKRMAEIVWRDLSFEDTDFMYADAVTVMDFNADLYKGKCYHNQIEVTEGGMSAIQNELVYCLNLDDGMLLFIFEPYFGVGIGTQKEQFLSYVTTIELAS